MATSASFGARFNPKLSRCFAIPNRICSSNLKAITVVKMALGWSSPEPNLRWEDNLILKWQGIAEFFITGKSTNRLWLFWSPLPILRWHCDLLWLGQRQWSPGRKTKIALWNPGFIWGEHPRRESGPTESRRNGCETGIFPKSTNLELRKTFTIFQRIKYELVISFIVVEVGGFAEKSSVFVRPRKPVTAAQSVPNQVWPNDSSSGVDVQLCRKTRWKWNCFLHHPEDQAAPASMGK